MQDRIVAHRLFSRKPIEEICDPIFESLTQDQLREIYDEIPYHEPTEAEIDVMYEREVEYQKALYQYAQSKFNQLHPFSRPDSLTRRGDVIVLRYNVGWHHDPDWKVQDWIETVNDIFNNRVTVHHAEYGADKNVRVWFTPHTTQDFNKGWL